MPPSTGLSLFDRMPLEIRFEIYRQYFVNKVDGHSHHTTLFIPEGLFKPLLTPKLIEDLNNVTLQNNDEASNKSRGDALAQISPQIHDEIVEGVYRYFTISIQESCSLLTYSLKITRLAPSLNLKQIRKLKFCLVFPRPCLGLISLFGTQRGLRQQLPNLEVVHLRARVEWGHENYDFEPVLDAVLALAMHLDGLKALEGVGRATISLVREQEHWIEGGFDEGVRRLRESRSVFPGPFELVRDKAEVGDEPVEDDL